MKFYKFGFVGFFIIIGAFTNPYFADAAANNSADIIREMNEDRAVHGLGTLRTNSALTQAAQSRSAYLASQGQIFHVTAPAGTPWKELSSVGYIYTHAGENLALGIETPAELEARWMASPTHRENILTSAFQDVGVGVTYGTYQGMPASYVVVYFGQPRVAQVAKVVPQQVAPVAPVTTPSPVAQTVPVAQSKQSPVVSTSKIASRVEASVTKPDADKELSEYKQTASPVSEEAVAVGGEVVVSAPVSALESQEVTQEGVVSRILSILESCLRHLRTNLALR